MQKFAGQVQDNAGTALASPTITVYIAGSTSLATLYSNDTYTALANPFTGNTDGSYGFYARDGRYDVIPSKTGYGFSTSAPSDRLLTDPQSVLTATGLSTSVNNYNPANGVNASIWRITTTATGGAIITGIESGSTAQAGFQRHTLVNVGTNPITLPSSSTQSSAENRFSYADHGPITLQAGDALTLSYDNTSQRWRPQANTVPSFAPVDALTGLTLSNGTSSSNGLGIAAGACYSDDATILDRVVIELSTARIGTTTSTWSATNNAGKLDTGSVGNNQTWNVFAIKHDFTGIGDVLFSQSSTGPTMPTNYTRRRRVGAFRTDGSANIRAFIQDGDLFQWSTGGVLDINESGNDTGTLGTLTVPTGVNVTAILLARATAVTTSTATVSIYLLDPNLDSSIAPSISGAPGCYLYAEHGTSTATGFTAAGQFQVRTSTSGQIRYRIVTTEAANLFQVNTLGWLDRRGKG